MLRCLDGSGGGSRAILPLKPELIAVMELRDDSVPSFREDFLLEIDVRSWCGDIEHDKPSYSLFRGMMRTRIRCSRFVDLLNVPRK